MAEHHRLLDFGWGDGDGTASIRCRGRAVLPLVDWLANCCGWREGAQKATPWQSARVLRVTIHIAGDRSETVLRCTAEESGIVFEKPLSAISSLRRLRRSADEPPGMELTFIGQRTRLQLRALEGGEAKHVTEYDNPVIVAFVRFQCLHAFLTACGEAHNAAHAQAAGARLRRWHRKLVSPLEWPHPEGRRASLAEISAVLRGVRATKAGEVRGLARFAGLACPVCLDPWEEMPASRPAVTLNCGHAFCEACLGPAVAQLQAACPSCRTQLGPAGATSPSQQPAGAA